MWGSAQVSLLHGLHACRYTALEEEFQFFEVSKRVAYSAAVRAAISDILSKEELDDMFPRSVQAGKGVFDLVRYALCPPLLTSVPRCLAHAPWQGL